MSEIRKFLAKSAVSLPEKGTFAESIDEAEKSAALVRAGDVSDAELKEPELFCACAYWSIFDFYWHFRFIQIGFIDAKTGKVVLRVGQSFDTHQTENAELDDIFSAISRNFFPDHPNPFK